MKRVTVSLAALCVAAIFGSLIAGEWKSGKVWPEPPVVSPGKTDDAPPSDAIVLFGGEDLSAWNNGEKWEVADGVATVRGANIETKQEFGDCQIHIEWMSPEEVKGSGQGRGNSGIFLMGRYEIQILDSYENETYFDGQAASVYKQNPPLVNACRKPGEWQSFDIVFTAPKYEDGKVVEPAYVTVFHNGVLVQNHFALEGSTAWHKPPEYDKDHPTKAPIRLQNHGNPVKYRNIWIREL